MSVVFGPCWLMSLFLETTDTTDELGLSAVPSHFLAKDALEFGYFFFFVWDLWTTSVSAVSFRHSPQLGLTADTYS